MIVNTDADNQYYGGDIPKLVAADPRAATPTWSSATARSMTIEHFSPLKKALQRLGSWVVRRASQTDVPDTTSGFRAYNREAALQLQVVSKFTYTLETIIQAGKMLVAVDHVPIRTNAKTRESRLFPSMWSYVRRNAVSIFRIYAMYEPLRVFMTARGRRRRSSALVVWARFLVLLRPGRRRRPRPVADPRRGAVHRRVLLAALGVIGDLLAGQRIMLQRDRSSACGGSSSSSASRPRTTSRARADRPASRPPARTPAAAGRPRSARR